MPEDVQALRASLTSRLAALEEALANPAKHSSLESLILDLARVATEEARRDRPAGRARCRTRRSKCSRSGPQRGGIGAGGRKSHRKLRQAWRMPRPS